MIQKWPNKHQRPHITCFLVNDLSSDNKLESALHDNCLLHIILNSGLGPKARCDWQSQLLDHRFWYEIFVTAWINNSLYQVLVHLYTEFSCIWAWNKDANLWVMRVRIESGCTNLGIFTDILVFNASFFCLLMNFLFSRSCSLCRGWSS